MKGVHGLGIILLAALISLPGQAICGDPPSSSNTVQEEEKRVGEALEQAQKALRTAMEALAKAGQLTVDQQVPKLKEQADQTLQGTQKLLNQWEEELLHELEKRKGKKGPDHSPPPFDDDKEEGESPLRI